MAGIKKDYVRMILVKFVFKDLLRQVREPRIGLRRMN